MPLRKNKVIIGISGHSPRTKSVQAITRQVREAGGEPVFLACPDPRASRQTQCLSEIHGLAVMGNDYDIDPGEYIHRYEPGDHRANIHPACKNEMDHPHTRRRATYEKRILEGAISLGMPVLGICGGMQRINVLCGGTLHQHLPDMVGCDKHMQTRQGVALHVPVVPIIIKDGTRLCDIARTIRMPFCKGNDPCAPKVVMENSLHHQAIDRVGDGLRVSAVTDTVRMRDGRFGYLPEAIEPDPEGPYRNQFLLGVQWHPEFGASSLGEQIVKHLLQAAQQYGKTRKLKFQSASVVSMSRASLKPAP